MIPTKKFAIIPVNTPAHGAPRQKTTVIMSTIFGLVVGPDFKMTNLTY
jgi:hypothetical protein